MKDLSEILMQLKDLYVPVAMPNAFNAALKVKDAWAAIKTQTGGSTTMSHLVDEVTPWKQGGVSEKGFADALNWACRGWKSQTRTMRSANPTRHAWDRYLCMLHTLDKHTFLCMERWLQCFHSTATQDDLCWHAARVETLGDLMERRGHSDKTLMNNDLWG